MTTNPVQTQNEPTTTPAVVVDQADAVVHNGTNIIYATGENCEFRGCKNPFKHPNWNKKK